MKWIFKDGIPIYSQIVEQMKLHIASGAYKMGDKLPSVRDLAVEAGVNPNTMQRAFAELERDGLLHSERTRGKYEKRAWSEFYPRDVRKHAKTWNEQR